ncbi:RES domain-containing protein, partial [Acinetobacter baumannii]|nr:RES domain-containing protein [Acinetobacter baumannii]
FDPEYLLRYERSSFIQNLSRKLVMPVVPELEETNYLLTQAIADYLSTFEHCELDGILFASAQKPKESTDPSVMNIILFHKSSGVLNADRRFREAEVNMYQHDED